MYTFVPYTNRTSQHEYISAWLSFGRVSIEADSRCPVSAACLHVSGCGYELDSSEIWTYTNSKGFKSLQLTFAVRTLISTDNGDTCAVYTSLAVDNDNEDVWHRLASTSTNSPNRSVITKNLSSQYDDADVIGVSL